MEAYRKLLLSNKAWIKEKLSIRPDYFERLARDQSPTFLWIGCSDSRVPAEEITGTEPGELFVHRNIANLVVHTDLNLLSVLQYAVDVLKVPHIIVCGHYGCGGIRAAMTPQRFGLLNKWLRHIKDIYHHHKSEIEMDSDPVRRTDRLVEINVMEQVHNLAKTSIVQRAWKEEQRPVIHGWVYELSTGEIHEKIMVKPGTHMDSIYEYDFSDLE